MRLFRRRAPVRIEMDETGVRRLAGNDVVESVEWAALTEVDVATTSAGPSAQDVYWLLGDAAGRGVAVPADLAPDGLLARLQALDGFDNDAVIRAMGSTNDARFVCWRAEPG